MVGRRLTFVAADEKLSQVAVLLNHANERGQSVGVEQVSAKIEPLEAHAVVDGRAAADQRLGERAAAVESDAVLAEVERRNGSAAREGAGEFDGRGVAELVSAEVEVANSIAEREPRDCTGAARTEAVAVERELEDGAVLADEDLRERVAPDFRDLVLRKVENAETDLVLSERLGDEFGGFVVHLDVAEAQLAEDVRALDEGAEK